MSDAVEAQGTQIDISSGTGGAENITAIAKGAKTKVTITGTARAVGDVVAIAAVGGMTQLNGNSYVVIGVETDAIWLEVDSTAFTTYTSGGTATPDAWTEIGEAVDWSGPGGSASVRDVSHLKSTAKEKRIGLMDEGQYTFNCNRVFTDNGQQVLALARANRTQKNIKLTYPDATTQTFAGYVLGFQTAGGVDQDIKGSVSIEITGAVTTTPGA